MDWRLFLRRRSGPKNKTMSQKTLIYVGGIVLAIFVVLGLAVLGARNDPSVGGTEYDVSKLVGDVYQGLNEVKMMSGGEFVGPIDSAATASFSGLLRATDFTRGGTQLSTTTTSTSFGTLTQAQMTANSIIHMTPNVSSATTTLPATSTLTTLLANTGDTRSWVLINGTSTASRTAGIAAGTGIILDSKTLNNNQIAPGASALLTCARQSTTDVRCIFDPFVVGD